MSELFSFIIFPILLFLGICLASRVFVKVNDKWYINISYLLSAVGIIKDPIKETTAVVSIKKPNQIIGVGSRSYLKVKRMK